MSRKPDAMDRLAMARPASLDRGSRVSAADMLVTATTGSAGEPSPGPSRPGRLRPAAAPARSRRWTPLWAPLATTAIVVLVFTLVTNLAPAPAVLTPPRANQELFDLADRIERLPAGGGAYWREVAVDGGHLFSGGYTLLVVDRRETWQPRDPADPVLTQRWRGSARPATAADERRWRAAGSPARVKGHCETGESCGSVPVAAAPEDCRYTLRTDPAGIYPDRTVGEFTMADLAALPTEPAELRKRLRAYHAIWYSRGFTRSFEEFLPSTVNLLGMPLSPAQRAAIIRVLAGLPTTKVVGAVTDPLGRRGISVDFGGPEGFVVYSEKPREELPVRYRQILDPETGEKLSSVSYAARTALGATEGQIMAYQARGSESGWTGPPASPVKGCEKGR
ncbi:CU044_5270 family protein [Planomonospora sp. ID82291]|uniref:CU044_5270 family protein n=1 Tax=Planomonospora sp. ID82291 TaxID=2738136 RepID=UPI0018C3C1BD|nr:CU044_5270 family protein [Planomonospora sp. ID82291]MBG0815515.1 CU044_5270 family protein [Planomonospora sp. ID82291]